MLTRTGRLTLLTALLLAPESAIATPLQFDNGGGGYSVIWDGVFEHRIFGVGGTITGITIDTFTSPPAVVEPNAATGGLDFTFSEGLMTVYGPASTAVGWIPLLPFTIQISAPVHEQTHNIWPGNPLVANATCIAGGSSCFTDLVLGHGTLEPAFAASLGIAPQTVGGYAWLSLDDVWPGCGDLPFDYCIVPNHMFVNINVRRQAPEPATLALVTLGLFGLRRRVRQGGAHD